jgi:hypothetical protein
MGGNVGLKKKKDQLKDILEVLIHFKTWTGRGNLSGCSICPAIEAKFKSQSQKKKKKNSSGKPGLGAGGSCL